MPATLSTPPAQYQLLLPVLDTLAAGGGAARTTDLYDAVAARIGLDAAARDATTTYPTAGRIKTFERAVRWAQQRGKLLGLLRPVDRGSWAITDRGRSKLRESQPGVVITIFTTDKGVALWAAAEDAIGYIENGSQQLILTSPPYPLLREKAYGNEPPEAYLDWFLRIAQHWPEKLTSNGSIVLNLADVWEPQRPTLSLYQERLLLRLVDELGLRLCQRFAWHNPSKLPSPAQWVTVNRVRVKPSVEQLYWLSPSEHPYADNREVLVPYGPRMEARLAEGGEQPAQRPSGHAFKADAFGRDNGGAIPGTLIQAPNTVSNDAYLRGCRAEGVPPHPARFPAAIPEFFIKLLTRPGDCVWDPFGGSSTTGAVAERLDRHWITSERILAYVIGAQHRFPLAAPQRA